MVKIPFIVIWGREWWSNETWGYSRPTWRFSWETSGSKSGLFRQAKWQRLGSLVLWWLQHIHQWRYNTPNFPANIPIISYFCCFLKCQIWMIWALQNFITDPLPKCLSSLSFSTSCLRVSKLCGLSADSWHHHYCLMILRYFQLVTVLAFPASRWLPLQHFLSATSHAIL